VVRPAAAGGLGGMLLAGNNQGLTGSNEVQTVQVPLTHVKFTFNFGGAISDVIDLNADNDATVRTKLEAMPSIGEGNVTVTSAVNAATGIKTYTVTFVNALGGYDVPIMTSTLVATGGNEVQNIIHEYRSNSLFTTRMAARPPIAYNATPAALQTNINNA
jgi:hypothetical protein